MPLGSDGLTLSSIDIFHDLHHQPHTHTHTHIHTYTKDGKLFPPQVRHRSEDFKQLHLWLLWGLSTVLSLTQLVHCYLACGWHFPQPFTLGLHFSHSLALSARVPLRGLIGRLSHRETDRARYKPCWTNCLPWWWWWWWWWWCGEMSGWCRFLCHDMWFGCDGSRCLCTVFDSRRLSVLFCSGIYSWLSLSLQTVNSMSTSCFYSKKVERVFIHVSTEHAC